MRQRTRWAWGLLALAVVLAGCTRVKFDKTISIDSNEVQKLQIDPQTSDLKVTVTGHSADVPVNACLVVKDDEAAAMDPLMNGKAPPKALASALASKDFTLDATLPAGKEGVVMLSAGDKKADVKVSLVGK